MQASNSNAPRAVMSREGRPTTASMSHRTAAGGRDSSQGIRNRVDQAAEALRAPSAAPGCVMMRHWSEIPVWGVGLLGIAMLGMGAFGAGSFYFVAGGIDLGAAIPLFPIVRRYGTVRQQVDLLEGVINEQKATIREVEANLRALNAEVEEFAENESEISEHVEVLVGGIARLRDATMQLGQRIRACREQRDQLGREVAQQTQAVSLLQQALQTRNQELQALKETAEGLLRRPQEMVQALQERTRALQEFAHQVEQVRPSITEEQAILRVAETATARLESSNTVRLEVQQLQEQLAHFNIELTQLAAQQNEQLERIQHRRETLERGLPDILQTLEQMERELGDLSQSMENAESSPE